LLPDAYPLKINNLLVSIFMKKHLLLLSWFWLFTLVAWGQVAPPTNVTGQELRKWFIDNWYTGKHVQLGYDGATGARGRMYNFIDNNPDRNKVACVYGGYQVDWAYGGTGTNPVTINCEHIVPQSFFSGGAEPMKSDLHHLLPSYPNWNSTRSNFPFDEIDDADTEKWMVDRTASTAKPSANVIDNYSEFTSKGGSRFEPREDIKGDIARAIFYFYTMYEGNTSVTRPISAVGNIDVLFQWHINDPVDEKERERNNRVELYQKNRNPFIDYPEALALAWGFAAPCSEIPALQITAFAANAVSTTSTSLQWQPGAGDARLIVMKEGEAAVFEPDAVRYTINSNFNQAPVLTNGFRAVHGTAGAATQVTGLLPSTTYYVKAFEYCSGGEGGAYLLADAPELIITTADLLDRPTVQASAFTVDNISFRTASLSWTRGDGEYRLVKINSENSFTEPVDGTQPTPNATYYGGEHVVYNGNDDDDIDLSRLMPGTIYYVKIWEYNNAGIYTKYGDTRDEPYMFATQTLPAFMEDFETGAKGGYALGTVNCTTGQWEMADALIGNLAADKFNDSKSVRMRNLGHIQMMFDKQDGVGTVRIHHAVYGTETGGRWKLQLSTDGGANWQDQGEPIASSMELQEASFIVNHSGPVRLKIQKLSGGNRLNIDDVIMDNFTDITTNTMAAVSAGRLVDVYPNPNSGVVHLEAVTAEQPQYSVKLFRFDGKQLVHTNGRLQDVSAQVNAAMMQATPGVYLLQVIANGQVQNLTLIRQ
jgi:hypothetical protein